MLRRLNLAAPQVREGNTFLCGTQTLSVDQYIASAISRFLGRILLACTTENFTRNGISIN